MKFDASKEMTLSARRSLSLLNKALVELLTQKDFKDITVQDLCEQSMISKSSFYNYFDDKYDLLRYFFQCCKNSITQTTDNSFTDEALPRLLDAAEQHRKVIRKVLRHNASDGVLQSELLIYLNQVFERLARVSPNSNSEEIPIAIKSRINTYTFLTILEWAYTQDKVASPEDVHSYLARLYIE